MHAGFKRAEDECHSAGSHDEPVRVMSGREEISEAGGWRARDRSRAAGEPQEESMTKGGLAAKPRPGGSSRNLLSDDQP